MEKVDIAIVGGGVIGLSSASILADNKRNIVVLKNIHLLDMKQAAEIVRLFIRGYTTKKAL